MSASAAQLIRKTPLVPFEGALLKLENLQWTGSFKIRGATRAIAELSTEKRAQGVVTASAGNHGAGLAAAGLAAGVSVVVFVPQGTPDIKRNQILSRGGTVEVAGENYEASEIAARKLSKSTGKPFVSAFDDEAVIAGNGRDLGEEILGQYPRLKRILVPVGGGGLVSGMAQSLQPRGVEVIGISPKNNCAMHESLRDGVCYSTYTGLATCAEGLEGPVCERTLGYVRKYGVRVLLVSEREIEQAVVRLFNDAGQVVECSGAVATAGLVKHQIERDGTVVLVSGGNIDPGKLAPLLSKA